MIVGRRLTTLALAFAAVGSIGCGGASSPGDPPGKTMASGDGGTRGTTDGAAGAGDAELAACAGFAAAQCARQADCNAPAQASTYGSEPACVTRTSLACRAGLTAPGTAATPAKTAACGASISTQTCTDNLDLQTPIACLTPAGAAPDGAVCSHSAQCASAFCAIAPDSACGECAAQPKPGAPCAQLTTCGQGLACYKGKCVKYVTRVGDPCGPITTCGAGLDCVVASGQASGICEISGFAVGASCDPKTEARASCYTALGLYCVGDPNSGKYGTCQRSHGAAAGAPCGRLLGAYCEASTCVKGPGDAGAVCVAQAADGSECDVAAGPACIPPARCTTSGVDGGTAGHCALPAAACP